MPLQFDNEQEQVVQIKVIGVGGGGGNAVNRMQQIARRVQSGELSPEQITEQTISDSLYCPDEPEPDLIVRPSGEFRLSNFLLWQSAYSELVFLDVLWPDFGPEQFDRAIAEYQTRSRRFGAVK